MMYFVVDWYKPESLLSSLQHVGFALVRPTPILDQLVPSILTFSSVKAHAPSRSTLINNHMANYTHNNEVMKPLTEAERTDFHSTYGEMPILTAEFDNNSTVNYQAAKAAGVLCITITGCPLVIFVPCCMPAMRKSAESRQITLGENSLFYRRDGYCCCGPCMCNCSTVEQQVPLDKLQDLKLSQDWCAKFFDLWNVSMETAGQSGPEAGPELSLVGLKDARAFKQRVLAQRNAVASSTGRGAAYTAPPSSGEGMMAAPGAVDVSQLTPILLRIADRLDNMQCVQK